MQLYIQELVATSFFPKLPLGVRRRVLESALVCPDVTNLALNLLSSGADEKQWRAAMRDLLGSAS